MSVDREHIIHTEVPKPEQLKRLAAIGVGSAASRQRLRHLARAGRSHYFVDEVDLLAEPQSEESSYPQEIRHRMAGRVGVRLMDDGVSKLWSLKYFDTYWVNSERRGWIGERALYRFEWDRARTLLAERSIRMVGDSASGSENSLDEYLERFYVRDDEASIWEMRQDFETVTAKDCDLLIESASTYFYSIDLQGSSDLQ